MRVLMEHYGRFMEFCRSNSGEIRCNDGIGAGVLAGSIAIVASVLGIANRADAMACYGVAQGSCDWVCTPVECGGGNFWADRYCHLPAGDYWDPHNCTYMGSQCGC